MKRYTTIEWDEHNIDKNEIDHGVVYTEINEAFENPGHVRRGKKHPKETRKFLYGVTDSAGISSSCFKTKARASLVRSRLAT